MDQSTHSRVGNFTFRRSSTAPQMDELDLAVKMLSSARRGPATPSSKIVMNQRLVPLLGRFHNYTEGLVGASRMVPRLDIANPVEKARGGPRFTGPPAGKRTLPTG
jgi:hypothetical protein